jgi:hypothetical protein
MCRRAAESQSSHTADAVPHADHEPSLARIELGPTRVLPTTCRHHPTVTCRRRATSTTECQAIRAPLTAGSAVSRPVDDPSSGRAGALKAAQLPARLDLTDRTHVAIVARRNAQAWVGRCRRTLVPERDSSLPQRLRPLQAI